MLKKDKNDKFGLTLQGAMPVVIENVDFNSPAFLCGMRPNDVILSVNGMDVVEKNHKFLVELLQSSGSSPIFEVEFQDKNIHRKQENFNIKANFF